MSFELKSFGAFVRQLAKQEVRQAATLALYVRHPYDTVKQVRQEIVNDTGRGLITAERAAELQGLVGVCILWHKTHGQVETHLDSSDWASLGEGAHMRRRHLDENYEAPMLKAMPSSLEEKLAKEEDDE